MEALLPNSMGLLNHFGRVFQQLVRRHMSDMLDFIILQDNASRLFDYILPYLNYGAVADALFSLMFFRDADKETREKRVKCYQRLSELNFLEWFLDVIQCAGKPGRVAGKRRLTRATRLSGIFR